MTQTSPKHTRGVKPLVKGLIATLLSLTFMNVEAVTTPTSFFQSSVITGSNNRISVQRVPVVDVNGKVTYKDLTIDFTVSNTGILLDQPALITASPSLTTSNFVTGKYKDTKGFVYELAGPSVVTGTTRTAWSLTLIKSANNTLYNFSLNWITGPIAGHPIEAMLTSNKLTSTAYSWGTVGTGGFPAGYTFSYWLTNNIVGAIQTGNQLTLHYYLNHGNNVEDGSASLTYCPTC